MSTYHSFRILIQADVNALVGDLMGWKGADGGHQLFSANISSFSLGITLPMVSVLAGALVSASKLANC